MTDRQRSNSIDPAEIAKFEAMAAEWWDENGKFKPLHMLNPCRLEYITTQIAAEFGRDRAAPRPFEGLRILDIGCGGGLLAEPLTRLGAKVTGVDAAKSNIEVAKIHAQQVGLEIDYQFGTAEAFLQEAPRFDVVLAMEIVEHVAQPADFIENCAGLLAPQGLLLCSTINRNLKSYAVAIIGAEHIMRWLPKGTHEWDKFITPDELSSMSAQAGLEIVDKAGFVFDPLAWDWHISHRDLSVNYVIASRLVGQ